MRNLLEEQFFIWLNFETPPWESEQLTPVKRKWFIDRFVQFKEKEAELMQQRSKKK